MRAPTSKQRTMIIGRTGSGKSQFAIHLLSSQNWDKQPWVIIDYKGDDLLRAIVRQNRNKIKLIKCENAPPRKPGLYYMNPTPKVDDEAMEAWLFEVWDNGRYRRRFVDKRNGTGLFIDEGYQLPQRDGFDILLTQGRSLDIPIICLYQRPTWMSRFAVAQADFFAIFDQNDERDIKTTSSFIKPAVAPNGGLIDAYSELDRYYCLWYDVSEGHSCVLKPAPGRQEILNNFNLRLQKPRNSSSVVGSII